MKVLSLRKMLVVSISAVALTGSAQVVSPALTPVIIGLPAGATYPQVISSNPVNGSTGQTPGSRQITITFDQPMNTTTFYWQAPSGLVLTQTAYWTNGNKTFVIPVNLQNNTTYQIPLNVNDQAFKSAQGVPLQSGYITFTTGQGGVVNRGTPAVGGPRFGTVGGTPIPNNTGAGTIGSSGVGTVGVGTSTGGVNPGLQRPSNTAMQPKSRSAAPAQLGNQTTPAPSGMNQVKAGAAAARRGRTTPTPSPR